MRTGLAFIIAVFFIVAACDTASNIRDPRRNYFLKYFGGSGNQQGVRLIANADGTFYILGNSRAADDSLQKIYIAKANAVGDVIWQKTYNEKVETEARDFALTSDGKNLLVLANRYPTALTSLVSVYFFDANSGAKSSAIALPVSAGSQSGYSNSVTITKNQDYLISGNSISSTDTLTWVYLLDHNTLALSAQWGNNPVVYSPGPATGHRFCNPIKTFDGSDGSFYLYASARVDYRLTNDLSKKYFAYQIPFNGGQGSGTATDNLPPFYAYGSNDLLTDVFLANPGAIISGVTAINGNNYFKLFKLTSVDLKNDVSIFESEFSVNTKQNNSSPYPLGRIPATSSAKPFVKGCKAGQVGYYFLANSFSSFTNSDILLFKTNLLLTPTAGFSLTFGGVGDDTAADVTELPDGHIIILGTFQLGNPVNQHKIVLIKLTPQGKLTD